MRDRPPKRGGTGPFLMGAPPGGSTRKPLTADSRPVRVSTRAHPPLSPIVFADPTPKTATLPIPSPLPCTPGWLVCAPQRQIPTQQTPPLVRGPARRWCSSACPVPWPPGGATREASSPSRGFSTPPTSAALPAR